MQKRIVYTLIMGGVALLFATTFVVAREDLASSSNGEETVFPTPIGAQQVSSSIAEPTTSASPRPPIATVQALQAQSTNLVVGPMAQMTPSPTPTPQYTVENSTTDAGLPEHVLRDVTGRTIRLGNDDGVAFVEAINEFYIVYAFSCYGCDATAVLPTGLYAYDRTTNATIPIGRGRDPVLADEWILHLAQQDNVKTLQVHNLRTGEQIQVADEFAARGWNGDHLTDLTQRYSLHAPTVAWVHNGLHIYDLNSRTRTTITPDPLILDMVQEVETSATMVIWSSYWGRWGYDLVTDTLFTIDTLIPPGWEHVRWDRVTGPRLDGEQLVWSYYVNGEEYIFTAPIVRGGQ
ncbi:MAG: hypothetical protein HC876_21995 [Chloroflexaceae bacterium]|nr:hypothetical protein [Chloroflexaceae bacterium]